MNTKVRAELIAFGATSAEFEPSRSVPWRWRTERVLAPATIDAEGAVVDLTDPVVRTRLERDHAPILAQHAMPFLDISQVTSKTRIVTQTISRSLFEDGAAGIRFPSNTDGRACTVLFEDRGRLVPAGPTEPLSGPVPELLTVCSEWGLILREHDLPATVVAPSSRRKLPAWLVRLLP